MKVLSVASECAPLVKTGGLADVAGALPGALKSCGVEMRTMLPAYPAVTRQIGDTRVVWEGRLLGRDAAIREARAAGLDLFLVDCPDFFDRHGAIYLDAGGADWSDNAERFGALSLAAARLAQAEGWRPDLLHAHDWQAGLVATYLRQTGAAQPCVLTIHNIAFGGLAPAAKLAALELDPGRFTPDGFEFYGKISALKAGLLDARAITTVSPTYAAELMTPAFGMGFDGVLATRAGDLTGILNGIDTGVWDPSSDAHAPSFDDPEGKAAARDDLRGALGLPDADGPLAVIVSRMTAQKGLDLLPDALDEWLATGGQVALLGSGDPGIEARWRALSAHPGVSVTLGYDEPLSHRLIAGGDVILVPSRFEPCGLTQLYGLRYGTLPVVARTGGLADTVIDANEAGRRAGVATGFVHAPGRTDAIRLALRQVMNVFGDAPSWRAMMENAMRHPVGWDASAAAYRALYDRLQTP